MEEIDLKDMFNYFVSKMYLVVIVTLFIFSLGCVYTAFIQKPEYKSYTTLLLTKEQTGSALTITDVNLNKSLVDTYRELIKSKKIAKEVIFNLNLDCSAEELNEITSVESVNDTNMIKITVVNPSAKKAEVIANEIAEVFSEQVVNYFDISNIGIVDHAEVQEEPYNINITKQLAISLLLGVFMGLGVVFVIYYFDNTVKSGEQIENKLGLSVIGYIPSAGGNY